MTQLHQFTTFANYFRLRETSFSSQLTTINSFEICVLRSTLYHHCVRSGRDAQRSQQLDVPSHGIGWSLYGRFFVVSKTPQVIAARSWSVAGHCQGPSALLLLLLYWYDGSGACTSLDHFTFWLSLLLILKLHLNAQLSLRAPTLLKSPLS